MPMLPQMEDELDDYDDDGEISAAAFKKHKASR
jgi:hypothetical protein